MFLIFNQLCSKIFVSFLLLLLKSCSPPTVHRLNYLEIRKSKQLLLYCSTEDLGNLILLKLLWDEELRCFCSVILAAILVVHL